MVSRRYTTFFSDASEALGQDRHREAALLFEQAYREARQHRSAAEEFAAAIWAGHSWENVGEYGRALALLTEAIGGGCDCANPEDIAVAVKRVYLIIQATNPRLPTLLRRISDLEEEASRNPALPESDLHEIRADLLEQQGKFDDALTEMELAYGSYSGIGQLLFGKASDCCRLNLLLGRRQAAEEWCEVLGETEIHRPVSRATWHMRRLDLAFFDQRPNASIARDLDDAATGVQATNVNSVAGYRARSAMLGAHHGDPLAAWHPARIAIATRTGFARHMLDKYQSRLLSFDYRLACVRHAAGIAPVDDLWYTQPQRIPLLPIVSDRTAFQARVAHARRAGQYAMLFALDLDNRYECDWREREIGVRIARLEEILAAFDRSAR